LLIVSHDRYFLEKLSDHLIIFEENGKIKAFYAPYKEYRQKLSLKEKTEEKEKKVTKNKIDKKQVKKKLSYKEQKEYETLETELAELEEKKKKLEEELNSGITDYEKLQAISEEINTLIEKIELKTLRWMELEELKEQLEK
jgi:ATP-binding cassette subfamily F protein uup